jgi:hypothetical protein
VVVKLRYLAAAFLVSAAGWTAAAEAQVYSNKEVGSKSAPLVDSLKQVAYPYALPIWGDKATKRGYTLPHSAGLSLQYYGQTSSILIDNMMVGFNGGTLHDLDGIVRFDENTATTHGVSFRPDIWLLPFLNIYAILGSSAASTEVNYAIWLPDTSGSSRPVGSFGTKVDFNATTIGLGFTPTLGVGGGWLALDMNTTWTDVPQLDQPAFVFVFDPRAGKSFRLRNPDENIAVWVGGFRVSLNTGTSGSIPLSDALPIDQWQASVDQAGSEIARLDAENEAWWNSLSQAEQANPVNRARYEARKAAYARAAGFVDAADQAVNNAASSTVEYSLDKRPEDPWNFMIGTQYQMNRNWMARFEVGFITSRTHIIAGIQYRFGL